MTFYQELFSLYPYLISIRKLKNYLSIDVNFPVTWKLLKKFVPEDSVVENESKVADNRSFSFISVFDEESIGKVLSNIRGIISFNKEREAKEKLFQDKVNELKVIFDKQNLENLKNLSFELMDNKTSEHELTETE